MRRQRNAQAHALARRARRSFPILVWKNHVPLTFICFMFMMF